MSPTQSIWLHPDGLALSLESPAATAEGWLPNGTRAETLLAKGYTLVNLIEPDYAVQEVEDDV